jgi:hypothetical protein
MSLNLDEGLKQNLFGISSKQANVSGNNNNNNYNDKASENLVILYHPIDGNLVLSKQELSEKYQGKMCLMIHYTNL